MFLTGAIITLTPMIGWTWPALLPIISAASAALGYKTIAQSKLKSKLTRRMENLRRETISLDSVLSEVISEELGNEERIAFERDDLLLVFRKDAAGKFFIDVVGSRSQTALNLKLRGEEFARELVRKFAYHKMMEQIQRRGATVIEEELTEDGRNVIKCREWH